MKSKTLNMTEGNPVQLILIFAVPMLIGNVFQQLYNLVDSVIVGKFVGAEALASIGATNAVTFMFFALCNGIASGGGIITAQQFGAGNKDNIKKAIVNSAYILLTGSVVIGAIAFAICPRLFLFFCDKKYSDYHYTFFPFFLLYSLPVH